MFNFSEADADNDHLSKTNTGIEKAAEAVKKLGLTGIIPPEFTPDENGTDWMTTAYCMVQRLPQHCSKRR